MKRKFTVCFICSLALLALVSSASAGTPAPRSHSALTGAAHSQVVQDGKKGHKKQHPAKHKKHPSKKHQKHQRRGKKHDGKKHGGVQARVL